MASQRNLDLGTALAEAERRFVDAHPHSARRHRDAGRVMPGGNTRTVIYYPPFPVAIARGEGCHVWDIDGNRYISWKTEDQPEFTPSFQSSRDDVLRAWRIVEARPLAQKAAEELAAEVTSGGKTLEAVAAARGGLEVAKVGPFTWLNRGTAPFGAAPVLSQPEGLAMPGEETMRAVFALEPGQAIAVFNEPKTICYCVRLTALEPSEDQLKELFLASSTDPRRLAAVAEDDTREVYDRWLKAIEARHAVAWKREPRGPEMR
jgi:hypothetical protein